MATALVKGKLKAAREAIAAKDWSKAERNASDALTFEGGNYNGRVFLAVAKLNLGKFNESEEAYRTAIEAQPKTFLAWQGLASFYEKTERWPQYTDTQLRIADIAKDSEDVTKCAEALQKVLKVRQERGTRSEYLESLKLFLPESPYYAMLCQLPAPDQTNPTASSTHDAEMLMYNSLPILQELLEEREKEERAAIEKEVDKRRQRLTTTTSAEETRRIVMHEIMNNSQLPALYQQILDHHHAPDDLRRSIEQTLLEHQHKLLLSIPSPFSSALESAQTEIVQEKAAQGRRAAQSEKDSMRSRVTGLAQDIVTLQIPLELAWTIAIEWRDMQNEDDWDEFTLKRYIDLFPESGLSKLLHIVKHFKLPANEEAGPSEPNKLQRNREQDARDVDAALEAMQAHSIRAHVLASMFYLQSKDYEIVADVTQAGLSVLHAVEAQIGLRLPGLTSVLETDLAIALTHLNPPYQHTRALRLLDNLLRRNPEDHRCLLAKAYIYEHAEQFVEAADLFSRVHEATVDEAIKFETRAEKAWCLGNVPERVTESLGELHEVALALDQDANTERPTKAKYWWRYGKCLRTIRDEEHMSVAFDAFNTSILRDNTFAASFTALGFCYLEDMTDPDEDSARRCFQRAFELDEREEVAARMLAEAYADSEDWDLVESIARRLVRNLHASAGRYATAEVPTAGSLAAKKYGWAWKAIGVADLKGKRFEKAIPSLQHAVRGMQEEPDSWLQLALAYRGAGKHVAALKTLLRVLRLSPEDWHAQYLMADIQRQMGLFEEALQGLQSIQRKLPDELVVVAAIAETQLSLATQEVRMGFTARATATLLAALRSSLSMLRHGQTAQRIAWKIIGDGLSKLSQLDSLDEMADVQVVDNVRARLIEEDLDRSNSEVTVMSIRVLQEVRDGAPLASVCQALAVLSYILRMLLFAKADDAAGSAWYDIAEALHQLEHRYPALGLDKKAQDVRLESIGCVRIALQQEPLNGTFWNLLGVLAGKTSPKLAQHALIRAAELNVRSAVPWTNLGLFYLSHDDFELANKAFLRAQVLDPDYPQAWLGQAALARVHGDDAQADVLTEHAATLANGSVPDADLGTAWVVFKKLTNSSTSEKLIKAHFQVSRFLSQQANTTNLSSALHFYGLLSERLGLYEQAYKAFERAVKMLEALYEETESVLVEQKYILANVSLARAALANGKNDQALSAVQTASALVPEEYSDLLGNPFELRVQCLIIQALAQYFEGNLEASLNTFELAQEIVQTQDHREASLEGPRGSLLTQLVITLARVLYKLGGAEQVAEAERQLLENIYDSQSNELNVQVISTLSAMAILQGKEELLEAAFAEINKLPTDQRSAQDPSAELQHVLAAHHKLCGNVASEEAVYAHALHADPASQSARETFLEHSEISDVSSNSTTVVNGSASKSGEFQRLSHQIHKKPWETDADLWTRLQ